MMLISRKWLGDSIPVSKEIVEGRVLKTTVELANRFIVVWSVHNFGLTVLQLVLIADLVKEDLIEAHVDPTNRAAFLAGVWKFAQNVSGVLSSPVLSPALRLRQRRAHNGMPRGGWTCSPHSRARVRSLSCSGRSRGRR